jgi:hypothetical protein
MGINVSIYRLADDGSQIEHPDWDWCRHVGDRDLPAAMERLGQIEKDVGDFLTWYRPKDPVALCVEMCSHYPANKSRWFQLSEILSDGDWWLSFSY